MLNDFIWFFMNMSFKLFNLTFAGGTIMLSFLSSCMADYLCYLHLAQFKEIISLFLNLLLDYYFDMTMMLMICTLVLYLPYGRNVLCNNWHKHEMIISVVTQVSKGHDFALASNTNMADEYSFLVEKVMGWNRQPTNFLSWRYFVIKK